MRIINEYHSIVVGNQTEMPALNRRLKTIIDTLSNGKVNPFVELVRSKGQKLVQQRVDRLFKADKDTGKYPTVAADMLEAVVAALDVNANWLLTGNGEMFNSGDSQNKTQQTQEDLGGKKKKKKTLKYQTFGDTTKVHNLGKPKDK